MGLRPAARIRGCSHRSENQSQVLKLWKFLAISCHHGPKRLRDGVYEYQWKEHNKVTMFL
jgi:hypothetical protein